MLSGRFVKTTPAFKRPTAICLLPTAFCYHPCVLSLENVPWESAVVREATAHSPLHRHLREGAGVHARVQAAGLPRPRRHDGETARRRLAARVGGRVLLPAAGLQARRRD